MKKTSIQTMKKLKLGKKQIIALTAEQSNNLLGGGGPSSGLATDRAASCTLLASSSPTRDISRVCA